ncbi:MULTISPECIES: hypothetical protein [unclassified Streptomyces]|uniref:hypothetical protein n=1 Tax=unclassified Streptomyces TaxID=2593676 RepID=UPI000B509678|nr:MULTISPECIES: hypothetical protein [unclassified Streptomyces]SNB91105.1 hypothetical protein SAMN02745831_07423 [Streptomyces sp. PgraA7]
MTTPNELRLLPWSGPGDKPCYLSTDDPDGYMSRLADSIEATQLGTASDLLEEVSEAIDNQDTSLDEMRCLARELTGALRDVYRVATSRGQLWATSDSSQSAY